MNKISLEIISANSKIVPVLWQQPNIANIQRLYYIKGGSGYILQENGRKEPFRKNCIYIFPHNLRQSFLTDAHDPLDHIYFDFFSTPPIIAPQPLIYPVMPGSALAGAIPFLDRLLQELSSDDTGNSHCVQSEILSSALNTLLALLHREQAIPFSRDQQISQILAYIHQNYSAPLSVELLAKGMGFAPNAFIRRFKRSMGQTPYAYIKNYRLMKAKALLDEGVTVARTAELVGYENGSSLSRALAAKRNSF